MALIKCPECNKEISDRVKACPHCGYPFEDDTQGNESTQKVEISSVNIQPRDPAKTKKVLTGVIGVIVVAIIIIVAITQANAQKEKTAFNTYIDTLNAVSFTMLSGASEAETLTNLTAKVWQNSIYKESDSTTDKYTKKNGKFYEDFNDALYGLFSDKSTVSTIKEIESNQELVTTIMKDLQNPPEGLENCYDTITNMYSAYRSLTDLAINPTGSLSTFIASKNDKVETFLELYKKLETQIPEKK